MKGVRERVNGSKVILPALFISHPPTSDPFLTVKEALPSSVKITWEISRTSTSVPPINEPLRMDIPCSEITALESKKEISPLRMVPLSRVQLDFWHVPDPSSTSPEKRVILAWVKTIFPWKSEGISAVDPSLMTIVPEYVWRSCEERVCPASRVNPSL